jgi:hypothetical protein
MADVAATLAGWSSTTASNAPAGSTSIGTGLDDNLREIQGVITRGLSHKGADIASANGAIDIGAIEGLMHDITGALAITGFGTVRAGILKVLKFEGAATLTHNATSLILPGGANVTCADGDVGVFISEGSGNWRCLAFQKAAHRPGNTIVISTAQATTSGTAITFSSIPAGVKRITVMLIGVSTNGTASLQIQVGNSGGVENTGYLSGAGGGTAAAYVGPTESTSGFIITGVTGAGDAYHGAITLNLQDAADFRWTAGGQVYETVTANTLYSCAGSKALSAELDRVVLTTTNGTDTFDAGEVNISYEF